MIEDESRAGFPRMAIEVHGGRVRVGRLDEAGPKLQIVAERAARSYGSLDTVLEQHVPSGTTLERLGLSLGGPLEWTGTSLRPIVRMQAAPGWEMSKVHLAQRGLPDIALWSRMASQAAALPWMTDDSLVEFHGTRPGASTRWAFIGEDRHGDSVTMLVSPDGEMTPVSIEFDWRSLASDTEGARALGRLSLRPGRLPTVPAIYRALAQGGDGDTADLEADGQRIATVLAHADPIAAKTVELWRACLVRAMRLLATRDDVEALAFGGDLLPGMLWAARDRVNDKFAKRPLKRFPLMIVCKNASLIGAMSDSVLRPAA